MLRSLFFRMRSVHYIGILLLILNALLFTDNWIGQVVQVLVALVIVLHDWDEKVNGVNAASSIKHNFSEMAARMDLSHPFKQYPFSQEYDQLSLSISDYLSMVQQAVTEANQVMNAIAHGNFTQRMQGYYQGDLQQLKENINRSADSVSLTMQALNELMQAIEKGQLNVRADARIQGDLAQTVNQTMQGLSTLLLDIQQVVEQMQQGNFSARIQAAAQGDLQVIKQHINTSLEAMEQAITRINHVMRAQAQGQLIAVEQNQHISGQLGELNQAVQRSAQKLGDTIGLTHQTAQHVGQLVDELAENADKLSRAVSQQARNVSASAEVIHTLSAAFERNGDKLSQVDALTKQVQHQTLTGVETMQKTITAMQSIQASSHQIEEIVGLIDSIAFQTNLLALNAAVEAARAGEHGRGFAVVASEVRALAQKSADAAKQIKTLISESVQRISAGTTLADQSGQMLNQVNLAVAQVVNHVDEIHQEAQTQTQQMMQIDRTLIEVEQLTQHNLTLIGETGQTAQQLNEEMGHLLAHIAFFKR